ncbi:hypothetical protein E2320_014975 [Naja naja]|nr:hypothetical protein E2320_014975 [Naja naja]
MPYSLLSLRTNSTCAGAVEGKLYVCGGFRGTVRVEKDHSVLKQKCCLRNPVSKMKNGSKPSFITGVPLRIRETDKVRISLWKTICLTAPQQESQYCLCDIDCAPELSCYRHP